MVASDTIDLGVCWYHQISNVGANSQQQSYHKIESRTAGSTNQLVLCCLHSKDIVLDALSVGGPSPDSHVGRNPDAASVNSGGFVDSRSRGDRTLDERRTSCDSAVVRGQVEAAVPARLNCHGAIGPSRQQFLG